VVDLIVVLLPVVFLAGTQVLVQVFVVCQAC
jgi:hypothetical protein